MLVWMRHIIIEYNVILFIPVWQSCKSPITVHGSAEAEAVGHSAVADTVAATASVPLMVALWLHTSDTENLKNSY